MLQATSSEITGRPSDTASSLILQLGLSVDVITTDATQPTQMPAENIIVQVENNRPTLEQPLVGLSENFPDTYESSTTENPEQQEVPVILAAQKTRSPLHSYQLSTHLTDVLQTRQRSVTLPLPHSASRSNRKRKVGHAACLTSSPYKAQLEDTAKKTKKERFKKKNKRKPSERPKQRGQPSVTEDTTPCLFCEIPYNLSKVQWWQCVRCSQWACADCMHARQRENFYLRNL
jgi:hypothetical protein